MGARQGTDEHHLNRMVAVLFNRESGCASPTPSSPSHRCAWLVARQSRAVRADYEKHRARLIELKDDEESFNQYVSDETARYTARQTRVCLRIYHLQSSSADSTSITRVQIFAAGSIPS